jgi:hypothetical protein
MVACLPLLSVYGTAAPVRRAFSISDLVSRGTITVPGLAESICTAPLRAESDLTPLTGAPQLYLWKNARRSARHDSIVAEFRFRMTD